jgi:hypothetical protein
MLFSALFSSPMTPNASAVAAFPTYFAPRGSSPATHKSLAPTAPQPALPREERDLDQLVREIGEW